MDLSLGDWVLRLAIAIALSGLIGFEREASQKAAGLRTHMLVGLGAALFTLVGVDALGRGDPGRVAAQVVTGIGFLGAGAIFRSGPSVHGLTTAAGLWAVAAIGVTVAAGELAVAFIAAGAVLVVLYALSFIERYLRSRLEGRRLSCTVTVRRDANIPGVVDFVSTLDDSVEGVRVRVLGDELASLHFAVRDDRLQEVLSLVTAIEGVVAAEQSDPGVRQEAAG